MLTVVAVSLGIGLGYSVVLTWWSIHRAKRKYPKPIIDRLRRTGAPVVFRLWFTDSTWNPAKPKVSGRLRGPGRATYTLDDSGTVHLLWQAKGQPEQHLVGAIPDEVMSEPPGVTRQRRLVRRVVVGYIAFLVVGFVLGYSLSGGSQAKRFVVGVVALFGAMLLVSMATTVIRVGMAVRSVTRDRGNPPNVQ